MDEGDVALREEEEQRVIEATIHNRLKELHGESPASPLGSVHRSDAQGSDDKLGTGTGTGTGAGGFGSSLDHYNRSRTFSNSSTTSSASTGTADLPRTPTRVVGSKDEADASVAIQLLAISPDDRRALESEMRAQLSHDTHRRMESEAEETRMRHVQEWYGSDAGMRSRMRETRLAELTALLERLGTTNRGGLGDNLIQNGGEYEARGAAPNLSRLLRALENSSDLGGGGRNRHLEELMRLEAALILGVDDESTQRSRRNNSGRRFSRRVSGGNELEDNDSGEAVNAEVFGVGGRPPSIRGINRLIRSRQNRRGVSSTQLDTAELLMRGVSEEEQLAMAIAMSMQQQQPQAVGEDQQATTSARVATDQSTTSHSNDRESSAASSSSESTSSDYSDDGSGDRGRAVLLDEDGGRV